MKKRQTYILPSSSKIIKFLSRKGIPFEIAFTNSTTNIKCEIDGHPVKYLCSERGLRPSQLGFIQKVKTHVENLEKPKLNVPISEIKYFQYNDLQEGLYEPVSEVDVNKAYWELARRLGYISEDIFQEGLKIDKMTRLIAWGAIATTKRTYWCENGKKNYIGEKCNHVTRSYFFDVADELGKIMAETLDRHRKSILFYWVDAFFIRGTSAPALVQKEMTKQGLPCKHVPLWHIHVKERSKFMDLITVKEKGGKEKPFHRKKGNEQERILMHYKDYVKALEETGFL